MFLAEMYEALAARAMRSGRYLMAGVYQTLAEREWKSAQYPTVKGN